MVLVVLVRSWKCLGMLSTYTHHTHPRTHRHTHAYTHIPMHVCLTSRVMTSHEYLPPSVCAILKVWTRQVAIAPERTDGMIRAAIEGTGTTATTTTRTSTGSGGSKLHSARGAVMEARFSVAIANAWTAAGGGSRFTPKPQPSANGANGGRMQKVVLPLPPLPPLPPGPQNSAAGTALPIAPPQPPCPHPHASNPPHAQAQNAKVPLKGPALEKEALPDSNGDGTAAFLHIPTPKLHKGGGSGGRSGGSDAAGGGGAGASAVYAGTHKDGGAVKFDPSAPVTVFFGPSKSQIKRLPLPANVAMLGDGKMRFCMMRTAHLYFCICIM